MLLCSNSCSGLYRHFSNAKRKPYSSNPYSNVKQPAFLDKPLHPEGSFEYTTCTAASGNY